MNGKFRNAGVAAALLLASAPCPASAQPPAGLAVVAFGDYLWLRIDGKAMALEPGAAAYEVPVGARAAVAQGAATLLVSDTLIRVDAGDDFTTAAVDGQVRLLVNAGAVEVAAPGQAPILVESGRFLALTGPQAGLLPGAAAPVAPPSPAAPAAPDQAPAPASPPPPSVPSAPAAQTPQPAPAPLPPVAAEPEWDPLAALAAGVSKLSRVGRPELRLVLELHPFYRLSQTYDSNIYLVPPDKPDGRRTGGGVLGSWITTNELGTGWKLPLSKRSELRGLYSAKATNYSNQPKTNNAVDQDIKVGYDLRGQRGGGLTLSESYLNTEDPAFSELVARQRRTMLESSFALDFERSRRFVFRVAARHALHKYLDPTMASSLNRYEASFGGEAGIKLAPKTKTFLAYAREIVHYSAGRRDHSHSDRFGLGLEGVLGPRVSGRIQADVQRRRYENPPAGSPTTATNLLTAVDLRIKAARRTDARTRLFRSVNETTFAGNRHYVATGLSLGLAHSWRKLALSGDASFETDRYPTSTTAGTVSGNRRDDLYSYGARVEYKVRPWLSTDVNFQLLQRYSLFADQFNYSDTRTGVGLKIQF
ncbi:MAG: outer membrane beta-barrel protein [Elusimicrobia bacterium]|nr:outer membrane beta-barrel protein [Elusimicrobiota bacterium]